MPLPNEYRRTALHKACAGLLDAKAAYAAAMRAFDQAKRTAWLARDNFDAAVTNVAIRDTQITFPTGRASRDSDQVGEGWKFTPVYVATDAGDTLASSTTGSEIMREAGY
jgi:hypothetical protein